MLKVRLEGEEHSAGRGVGFYRKHLLDALLKSGRVEIDNTSPDLVHYPYFDLFYPTLPQKLEYPTVVTIHDLTPLVLPSYYPKGIRALVAVLMQRLALKNVSAIVTDSLSSKKDIVGIFKIDPEKVFVTHLAVDPAYQEKPSGEQIKKIKEKYQLPDKFILYVGGVNPNKNLVRLARAATKLNCPVVFLGSGFAKPPIQAFSFKRLLGFQKTHPEISEFNKLRAIIQGNPLFHVLGFVPTEELNAIYRLASAYCQPSLYEGFGIPLLEAMTAGCLVVSANIGSLPEIYPLETIVFSPESEPELEAALRAALSQKNKDREIQIKAGKEKAGRFSWEKTAAQTLAVYLTVLGK